MGSTGTSSLGGKIVATLLAPSPRSSSYFAATTILVCPVDFEAMLRSSALRALMQLLLVLTALLFWSR